MTYVQPAPPTAAHMVSKSQRGLALDRLLLRSLYGKRVSAAASAIAREAPELHSAQAHGPAAWVGAVTDLAAVRLYLSEEWARLDAELIQGVRGAYASFARCVASGLRQLPSYRGPVIARAEMISEVADWYRSHQTVVDPGFWSATASVAALAQGGPGYLVWSLTGRRTDAVDRYAPQRVLFLPGTRFKVLEVRGSRQPLVVLREMFPQEPAEQPAADAGNHHGAWLDESTARELKQATAGPRCAVICQSAGLRNRPPGLIVQ